MWSAQKSCVWSESIVPIEIRKSYPTELKMWILHELKSYLPHAGNRVWLHCRAENLHQKIILYCCIYNKTTQAAKFSALNDEFLYKTANDEPFAKKLCF